PSRSWAAPPEHFIAGGASTTGERRFSALFPAARGRKAPDPAHALRARYHDPMNTVTDPAALMADLRRRIGEIEPAAALARQAAGALLLDVREDAERNEGMPAGAVGLSRGFLELRIRQVEPDRSREILTLCGSGMRSLLAAETLKNMGYAHVRSVAGGFARWKTEGLPVARDEALDADAAERYSRQLKLPNVGRAGQTRLARARVAMLGAGGLG